jgi:hypothetical protein
VLGLKPNNKQETHTSVTSIVFPRTKEPVNVMLFLATRMLRMPAREGAGALVALHLNTQSQGLASSSSPLWRESSFYSVVPESWVVCVRT